MFAEMTLKDFLKELSSDSPAPGGGSASGLAGALSASLICMVCGLTAGKAGSAEGEASVRETLTSAGMLRERFARLMDEDASAFTAVIAAYRLPKGTEEEKTGRATAVQAALARAAEVPLECARHAVAGLELCQRLVAVANPHAISDVGVGALLAEAAARGALLNVDTNARLIRDEGLAEKLRREAGVLRERSGALRDLVLAQVGERM